MKRQYINPTMDVVAVKMEQCLMAGSVLGIGEGTKNAADADSRVYDFDDWDE